MKRLSLLLAITAIGLGSTVGSVAAAEPTVQLIRHFPTVIAVRPPTSANFPEKSLMRANCQWLYRVVKPNGGSTETQKCRLSTEPVMIPEFQGKVPRHRVIYSTGECTWHSDYWWNTAGLDVMATRTTVLITPRGEVFVTSTYSRHPADCPDPS